MNIVHDPAEQRFRVSVPGGEGVLTYGIPAPGVLDLEHVEISPALRGKGVAGQIVEAACGHARAIGARVIPSCPYIAWWFRQHPEQQDVLVTREG